MNFDRFTDKANIYDKHRPSYPKEFIEYLFTEIGVDNNCVICDIGSGTGKLSEQFLRNGSKVICIEPNENMRQVAENNLSIFPEFISISGTAENTTLSENEVDFITVAQAYHWFDQSLFKAECKRIIKPKGKVILVWNIYDTKSDVMINSRKIFERLCPKFNSSTVGSEEDPKAFSTFFKDGVCEFRKFDNNLKFDLEGFIGRNLSESYAPKKSDLNYQEYIDELTDLFIEYSVDGMVTVVNVTRSYVGEI